MIYKIMDITEVINAVKEVNNAWARCTKSKEILSNDLETTINEIDRTIFLLSERVCELSKRIILNEIIKEVYKRDVR